MRFKDVSRTEISPSYLIYVSAGERLRGRHDKQTPLTAEHLLEHCQIVHLQVRVLSKFRRNALQGHLK